VIGEDSVVRTFVIVTVTEIGSAVAAPAPGIGMLGTGKVVVDHHMREALGMIVETDGIGTETGTGAEVIGIVIGAAAIDDVSVVIACQSSIEIYFSHFITYSS
jgi:hypothetical protein